MTKHRKLEICLLLYEKLTLQQRKILRACVKRFVSFLRDGENEQCDKYINTSLYSRDAQPAARRPDPVWYENLSGVVSCPENI